MAHVVKTMHDTLPDDPWHLLYRTPPVLAGLVAKGALGQKTKAGFFRKKGKDIQVLDPAAQDYRPAAGAGRPPRSPRFSKLRHPGEKLAKLRAHPHPQAQFLWAIFRDLFHYCAVHLAAIANSARDVDLAHPLGLRLAHRAVRAVAGGGLEGGRRLDRRGHRRRQGDGERAAARVGASEPGGARACTRLPAPTARQDNAFASALGAAGLPPPAVPRSGPRREARDRHDDLRDRRRADVASGDDIAHRCRSRASSTRSATTSSTGVLRAIDEAERGCAGLVIWQTKEPFSLGANLGRHRARDQGRAAGTRSRRWSPSSSRRRSG